MKEIYKMTGKTLQHAIEMEKQLNIRLKKEKNPFHLKYATIWTLTENNKLERIMAGRDIYTLLENKNAKIKLTNKKSFGIITCGWAAPIDNMKNNEDFPRPSEHPERIRVRLVVCADYNGVASVMRFQNKKNEIVTDEGQAKGSLADAINKLMEEIITAQINKIKQA